MKRKASDLQITKQPMRGVLTQSIGVGLGACVCLLNPEIICRIQPLEISYVLEPEVVSKGLSKICVLNQMYFPALPPLTSLRTLTPAHNCFS